MQWDVQPIRAALVIVVGVAAGIFSYVVSNAADEAASPVFEPSPAASAAKGEYPVPPPPFSEDIFPCTGCHNSDFPTNPKRRVLRKAHKDIQLHHDEEHRWCLDCHSADNRDLLRSVSGEPMKFEESYRLCGQCHGDKYRDWKAGVHGKRTGEWNGEKQYLLCVHCHNPHSPKFKSIQPMPPPVQPESIR